jgi:hypothetical protein
MCAGFAFVCNDRVSVAQSSHAVELSLDEMKIKKTSTDDWDMQRANLFQIGRGLETFLWSLAVLGGADRENGDICDGGLRDC